ncbi:hypothetical protein BC940DRAFT_296967 [Gongronella butleri]|nr:hypothetical protein BC940DRAFT_296967 [Gongronella butleri]
MKMTTAPLDDTTLTRLIKALAQLRVIVLVGVDDRRWVCIHLAKPWFIQTTNAGFVQPRPWMDLQGKDEQQHVRAIADQGVLAQIVHRPGISKEALHAATRTQWTLGDLDDILSRLASQGRIQCRTMVKQQPCTVFSKPVYQSLDSQANITVASTSHYWPCHNHYHRTHQ